jgi:hypothetical protein
MVTFLFKHLNYCNQNNKNHVLVEKRKRRIKITAKHDEGNVMD